MQVHPFRMVILIVLIGASVVNFLAMKQQHDAIYTALYPQPQPSCSPGASTLDRIFCGNGGPSYDKMRAYDVNHRLHVEITDPALTREAIIVTIAGIGWFLVKARVA